MIGIQPPGKKSVPIKQTCPTPPPPPHPHKFKFLTSKALQIPKCRIINEISCVTWPDPLILLQLIRLTSISPWQNLTNTICWLIIGIRCCWYKINYYRFTLIQSYSKYLTPVKCCGIINIFYKYVCHTYRRIVTSNEFGICVYSCG